jgi:hypothetical protein
MCAVRNQLRDLFTELDKRIEEINLERLEENLFKIPKARVQLLGQISLLANQRVSSILSLVQTGDMDALLMMDQIVKEEFKIILAKQGLVYDEDSYLIWVPPGAKFEIMFDLPHLVVESIDPESALVSKAVKAPEKNKQLIREAIASNEFATLVDRILANGGKLEHFA